MSEDISPALQTSEYEDIDKLFDDAYTIYQLEINHRENRPSVFEKFLYIDGRVQYNNMVNGFWHVSSIKDVEEETKYDAYPCNNDTTNGRCKYMCNLKHQDNFLKEDNRIPCIYRAARVKWIKEIIQLANSNRKHPNLRIWIQINQRKKEKNLLIRYVKAHIDFVIILNVSYKNREIDCYRLETAFPVVLKSYKNRFDREYAEYESRQKK